MIGLIAGILCALSAGAQQEKPQPTAPAARRPAEARPPQANDDAEAKILAVITAFDPDKHDILNVPEADGRLLRILTEATGAMTVVELGTAHGYSALWIALALRKTGGHLTTIEIDDTRVEIAKTHFEQAGVSNLITPVLGNAHEEVLKLEGPIDVLFIDADKDGYLDYLNKLLPKVRPGGLILAHNMKSPLPEPNFVRAITTNPSLEAQFYNMDDQGMAVVLKKR
jgi:predicted O-methyltransferase YrrM